MAKKLAISKKVTVKKGMHTIDVPVETIKAVLADAGFAGGLLLKATNTVFQELRKISKSGVISAVDFEKALVKGIKKVNDEAARNTKKFVKKLL